MAEKTFIPVRDITTDLPGTAIVEMPGFVFTTRADIQQGYEAVIQTVANEIYSRHEQAKTNHDAM